MTDHLITRLVVGGPSTLPLGQPVRQALEAAGEGALRWSAGTWVAPRKQRWHFPRIFGAQQPHTITIASSGPGTDAHRIPWRFIAAGAVLTLAMGAAVPPAWQLLSAAPPAKEGLPIAPAAATSHGSAVSVVSAAYVAPMPSGAAPDTQALPLAAPDAVAASAVVSAAPLPPPQAAEPKAILKVPKPTPAPAAAQDRPEPVKAAPPPRKVEAAATEAPPKQREQPPPSAVVLDEATHKAARQAPSTPVAAPLPPKAAPVTVAVAAAPAPTKPSTGPATAPVAAGVANLAPAHPAAAAPGTVPTAKPAAEHGTGLIAITPDGKLAVFTNPKTRLPQQFKIGDQLPGGDIVRSIDAKTGKVVSSSKEYSFE